MLKTSLVAIALSALANTGFANDLYRIKNPDSIITQRHEDLLKLTQLLAQGRTLEVRAFYKKLVAANECTTINPADRPVEVSAYYADGTVQIDFHGEHGYIAKEDLGERVTQDNQTGNNQPQTSSSYKRTQIRSQMGLISYLSRFHAQAQQRTLRPNLSWTRSVSDPNKARLTL
jgi:hypothetical protein